VRRRARTQRGIVLIAVVFFIALLVSGIATFLRRATLDGMIAQNRDLVSRSEALARGGVRLATALLLQDRFDEVAIGFRSESRSDLWARVGEVEIPVADGGLLRVRIEDAGSRLNLNGLLDANGTAHVDAESFLTAFLDKVIEEMPVRDEEKNYDSAALAGSLVDYVDADDVEPRGDREDDYYQLQDPPYRAPNRPLLSFDELRLVEGFDGALVDAIRPYATVFPFTGGGINPNTAPSHVLAVLYHGTSGDHRLADEETVRRILDERGGDTVLCETEEGEACTTLGAEFGTAFPPLSYTAEVFQVRAEARYGQVRRTVEAVIDRSDPAEPLVLSWRVR
jgi:type II secretory pathway component PulK